MQQFCMYGSVRGALGNWRPYRDNSQSRPKTGFRGRLEGYPNHQPASGGALQRLWARRSSGSTQPFRKD
jgi:hypothetical protein